MDLKHTQQDKIDVLTTFLQKLQDAGYNHNTRLEIIKAGTIKYYRQLANQQQGGQRLYRSAHDMKKRRSIKGLETRTWFKSARGDRVQPR